MFESCFPHSSNYKQQISPLPPPHLHAAALILPNKRLPASVYIKSAIKRGTVDERLRRRNGGRFHIGINVID